MSGPEDGRRNVLSAADWTEDGAFRHSFLYLFDEEDAHRLQKAGVILARAAIAGDPEDDPTSRFEAACRDAKALRVYLQEVRDLAREDEDDPQAAAVVERADHWQRQLEDVVVGMEANLRDLPAPKPKPGPPGEFVADLRRLLGEALKIRYKPGCRPMAHLVDALNDALVGLGEEPASGEGES
ncbi:MAG TPA: hypothetical protein VLF66_01760 [Thermoanaerobaculia bacterium]|nr:hypothetical protein [Thermoanaerobaculia bacterium]